MEELKKAIAIALTGPTKDEAIKKFTEKILLWQISIPNTELLVLDFGLGEFYKTGLIECWITNEIKAGYCGKFLFVFEGQTCPLHQHRTKHETFYILKGQVNMTFDSRTFPMKPGDVLPVPSGKLHSFTGLNDSALLIEISKPCIVDDNGFADRRIPIGFAFKKA
jgi:mannose-6-phosphate isomerase-like protein (cupin superfamily)